MKTKMVFLMAFLLLSVLPSVASRSVSADVGQGPCARSDISTNVSWFNDRGIDQPENWINQPSAMRFGQFTYVVWQGGTGFVPCIERFNHSTGQWEPSFQLAATNPIAGDGHGAPTIFITPTGSILVTYGAHISALKYLRGNIGTYPSFTAMTDIVAIATYPHFVFVQGRVWVFFRQGDACSTWGAAVSNNDGVSFASGGSIGFTHTYVGGVTIGDDAFSIYFQFVSLPNCGTDTVTRNNSYVAYYLPDLGNAFWCKSSPTDTQVGFVVPDPVPVVCRIESTTFSNFGMVRKTGFSTNESLGTVYALYSKGDAALGNWNTQFAIWNGSVWLITTIAGNDYFQDYSDFRIKSATDIDAYVLGNYTDPFGSHDGGIVNRYNWNGLSWTFVNTVLSPANSSGNNLNAPFVPVNGTDELYFTERIVNLLDAHSKLYLWNANAGFEGLMFTPLSAGDLISFLLFLVLVWVILLVIGFAKIGPVLFLAVFVGLVLSFETFFVFGDIMTPIILATVNLIVLAFTVGDLVEDRKIRRST